MDNATIIYSVLGAVGAVLVLFAGYNLFGIAKVEDWLLWAVTEAESTFGSNTGKLKLAMVYDRFIERFPRLQMFIPYSLFKKLVDRALESMKDMLKNGKIAAVIGVIEEEKKEGQ